MANTTGVTEVSGTAGVAVAERVAAAHSMWLSTAADDPPRPDRDSPSCCVADLVPLTEPAAAPVVTVAGAAGRRPWPDQRHGGQP